MTNLRDTQRLVKAIKSVPRPENTSNIWECVILLTEALENTLVLLDERDQQICDLKMDIERLDGELDVGSQI